MQEKEWFMDEVCTKASSEKIKEYLNLSPREIYDLLRKRVIEQDEACKKIATIMYQHLHSHRSVSLIAGPTGSGKSFITETLKDLFPEIVILNNIADLTQEGWSGSKKITSLFSGIESTYIPGTDISSLIILDECDKTFNYKSSAGGGNPSADVQAELLSIIHGADIEIAKNKEERVKLNTRPMSFIFAGAFERTAKENASSKSSIGFGASIEKEIPYIKSISREDIEKAGCIPELSGRIERIIPIHKIDEGSFIRILDNGTVKGLSEEFDIQISLSEEARERIAHTAFISGHGVRSLKSQIREYIDTAMFDDPDIKHIEIY